MTVDKDEYTSLLRDRQRLFALYNQLPAPTPGTRWTADYIQLYFSLLKHWRSNREDA
jgi:hypothetical protein